MINISNITLYKGSKLLLENTSVIINSNSKIALIGRNGSGKSALLDAINSNISIDSGEILLSSNTSISYIEQQVSQLDLSAKDFVLKGHFEYTKLQDQLKNASDEQKVIIFNQLEKINGWEIEKNVDILLSGLGFKEKEFHKKVLDFSGGWRMRLNLARALIASSDFLFLDEPTNHLDLEAIFWLENYLKSYQGLIVLISHDREFLNAVTDQTLEIENKKLVLYKVKFDSYEKIKTARLIQIESENEKIYRQKNHLQKYIDRFKAKASKAKQAQSKIKQLSKLNEINVNPIEKVFDFSFLKSNDFDCKLLSFKDLNFSYNNNKILQNINFEIFAGEKIAILGRNGSGKSTFLKLLVENKSLIEKHDKLNIAYFNQHSLESFNLSLSPFEIFLSLKLHKTEQEILNFLGVFGFSGEFAHLPLQIFSGGQLTRFALAKLVIFEPNLLILDEPTNHLDLEMKNSLIRSLIEFNGAIIFVSHDREMINLVADKLYLIENKTLNEFDGDIFDYQSRSISENYKEKTKSSFKKTKLETKKNTYQIKQSLNRIESELNKLNQSLKDINEKLTDIDIYKSCNVDKLKVLLKEQEAIKEKIDDFEILWIEKEDSLNT